MTKKGLSPQERIENLIIDKGNNPEKCWIVKPTGLTICINKTVLNSAKFSYLTYIGEIPKGKYVLHRCANKHCINPEHLFIGNLSEINYRNNKRKGGKRGSQHYNTKINESIVQEIKYLLKEGNLKQKEIAKMFNLTDRVISKIRHEKNWIHV
jgi:hypothetical protein